MNGRAHDVEAVLEELGIEVARREGKRLWGRCPYHRAETGKDDRKPSWFALAAPDRSGAAGQNHCYSCKAGGSLAWLVQHVRGYRTSYVAEEWLDAFVAAPPALPDEVVVRVDRSMMAARRAIRMPGEVMFPRLEDWPGSPREYVLERRHLTPAQVVRWGVGYAVSGWLAGRIVVPVRDARGALANYRARTFVEAETRYYCPTTREGPNLDVLFGEEHWPAFGARGRAFVTEGDYNAMAVERALEAIGERGALAAMGGSVPRALHVAKLATFEEVVILGDPDPAGEKVATRLDGALRGHVRLRRVIFPEGSDANALPQGDLECLLRAALAG